LKKQVFDSKGEERERVKVFIKGEITKGASTKRLKDKSRGDHQISNFRALKEL